MTLLSGPRTPPRLRLRLPFAAAVIVLAALLMGFGGSGSAVGMLQARPNEPLVPGTPVSSGSADDPLDGDPLDGDARPVGPPGGRAHGAGIEPSSAHARLNIFRSGRPSKERSSLATYDDDVSTTWQPIGGHGAWIWYDLGASRRLREIHWLANGSGAVVIEISDDRNHWAPIDRVDIAAGWQSVSVRGVARYVRLRLLPDEGGAPEIAEVAVFGKARDRSATMAQAANRGREQRRGRRDAQNDGDRPNAEARSTPEVNDGGWPRDRRDRVAISSEPGETRCDGKRGRCRAQRGAASVAQDCAANGSCTIDVRVDGGTAVCDASAGDAARAGRGAGRRGAAGGVCEAVADGGAVAIGDINP